MLLLSAILWFAQPAPLDMPRAEAYLVKDTEGSLWLEDRYDELDLWTGRTVLGRWNDREGRQLTVSKLDTMAPLFTGQTLTRERFASATEPLPVKRLDLRDQAIAWLAPFDLPEEPVSPRLDLHGFKQVQYLHGTNTNAVVCAFLPEKASAWYLAVWNLLPEDDFETAVETFEDEFLSDWDERRKEGLRSEEGLAEAAPRTRTKRRRTRVEERDLLRADAQHSVTNYPNWHVTSAPEFIVLDDLPANSAAVTTLTNELALMRAKYAAAFPSPVNGSNVLAVARIFKDRDEYLTALDDNAVEGMEWSGAYWSPARRELVAYLPPGGTTELLKTFRHEAFHQFLSYACAMIPTSPWLNEGFAQYFEDEAATDWGIEVDLDQVADLIPALMRMNYSQFYDGSSAERQLKYRLAWSLACFLEKGAPKVRFEPFKDLRRTYVESLLRHQDAERATAEAFGSADKLKQFIAEWKKFWEKL